MKIAIVDRKNSFSDRWILYCKDHDGGCVKTP